MPETLADIGEFGLIDRLAQLLATRGLASAGVTVGPGDDAAAFRPPPGQEILVTCDCLVEGRHYLPGRTRPYDLGRRAMVQNISDVGAMGGRPLYALVSLGLKSRTRVDDVLDLYRGFVDELGPMDAAVIGGNLTATTEADFIDITLIGAVEPELLVRRSTGRLSHAVLVTGFPGRSAAGLKLLQKAGPDEDLSGHPLIKAYNRPVHRAREGRALARSGLVSAMIDTSDGLLGDLGHVCRESGLGADLFLERLPLDDDLKEAAAALEIKARDLVLGESDDYELIITCQADRVEAVRRAVASAGRAPVAEIGRLTEVGQGLRLIGPGGDVRRVRSAGWDHFSGSRP